jgi:hypothetical protein
MKISEKIKFSNLNTKDLKKFQKFIKNIGIKTIFTQMILIFSIGNTK